MTVINDIANELKKFDKKDNTLEVVFPLFGDIEEQSGNCIFVGVDKKWFIIDSLANTELNYKSIVETMAQHNIDTFEFGLISHYHGDHYGNFEKLIKAKKVKKMYVPNPDKQELQGKFAMKLSVLQGIYNTFVTVCNQNSIPIEFAPTGDMKFGKADLFFYNNKDEDYAYYKSINSDDYNNLSICLNVNYLGKKLVFQGDCNYDAMAHFAGDVPANVDLLKSNHHGISLVPNIYRHVRPKTVVCTTTKDFLKSEYLYHTFESTMADMAAAIYILGQQREPIHITYRKESVDFNKNIFLAATNPEGRWGDVYLNASYAGTIKTGDRRTPFTELYEVIRYLNSNNNANVRVFVTEGDYSSRINYTNKDMRFNSLSIRSIDNEVNFSPVDKTKKVIFPSLLIQNCQKVAFIDIDFISDNENNQYQLEVLNSSVIITRSEINSVKNKTKDNKDKISVNATDNSFVYLNTVNLKNAWAGIQCVHSTVILEGDNHIEGISHAYIPVTGTIVANEPFKEKNNVHSTFFNRLGRVIFKGTGDTSSLTALQTGTTIINSDMNQPHVLQHVKLNNGFVKDTVYSIVNKADFAVPQYEGQLAKEDEKVFIGINNKWIKISKEQ